MNSKLKTENGFFFRYYNPLLKKEFFFLTTADYQYLPSKKTRQTGALPDEQDYLKRKATSTETPLSANEIFIAGRITQNLAKKPLHGISKMVASSLVRQTLREPDPTRERFVKKETAKKGYYQKFRKELGIREDMTDLERKNGPGLVVVGDFISATAETKFVRR